MKRPKYFDECPTFVSHPNYVLGQAIKVLEFDAKLARKEGNKELANAAMRYARAIKKVAEGETWAAAFEV